MLSFVSECEESAFQPLVLQATGTLLLQSFSLDPIIPRHFEDFQGMSTHRLSFVLFMRLKLDSVGTYVKIHASSAK